MTENLGAREKEYFTELDAARKQISRLEANKALSIQAKQKLIESVSLLSSFFNSPGAMRGVVEVEGKDIRHITDNAETAVFFGRTKESMSNMLASQMGVDQGFIDIWIKYYEESKNKNQQVNFEYEHKADTQSHFFSVTVNYIGESVRGFSRYTYVLFDITEHKRAQKALQKAHDELDLRVEQRTAELALSNDQLKQEIVERKSLEGKLKESQYRLEESERLAHLGSWEWNIITNTNIWSDEMFRIFGYIPGSIVPNHDIFSQALHPDDKERILAALERTVEKDLPLAEDYRIIRPDGSCRIVQATGNVHRDDKGRECRMVCAISDITELKRSEEELKGTLAKLNALIEASPIAINFLDPNGNVTLWSPAAERIFGWKSSEILGRPNPVVSVEKQSDFKKNLKKVLAGKTIDNIEINRNRKDGSAIDINLSVVPLRDAPGKIIGVAGMMTDITDRKQAEDELRYSESRFRELSEAAFEGIAITQQGKFIDVNSRLAQMFGCDVSEMIGREVLDFVAPQHCALVSKRIKKGQEEPYEHLAMKTDGSLFPVEIQARSMNHKGDIIRVSAVRDITERKNLEERLRLSHKMEAIGTLAGGVAHDFNNILGIILGNTELAMDDVPEWNPARTNLEGTKTACFRAKDVVRQLLSFSRKTDEERKPVKINPIITGALKLLRSSIPTSIEIRRNFQGKSETILADPTQINQIMINLCTNAAQAMGKDNGILDISMKNLFLEESRAQDHGLSPGRYVKLTVKDNGHGIAPEIKDRIFDPYFTTKETGKGSGMGLAVVHGIVQNHNGAIIVDSEPGKGTKFEIYLPVTQREPIPDTIMDEELPTGKERLLFVDDEDSVVKVTGQRLERLGYIVKTTTSPLKALDLLRSNPDRFELVITDLTMPHMSGDKLVKEMLNVRPDLPIILCTGFSEKIDAEKAKEIGASGYLEKPHDKRELAFKVREVLDGKIF